MLGSKDFTSDSAVMACKPVGILPARELAAEL